MNRTDRLFAMLLELRGDGWTQAEGLARTFEISVRTVYRDMLALSEAGVPVVSLPGKGYRLLEGYFLPPLHLTVQEALMLTLGANALREAFDAEYAAAATSALSKLQAALPEGRRSEVTSLRTHLHMISEDNGEDSEKLRRLRGAVMGRRVVTFDYHRPALSSQTRTVYPLSLIYLHGAWLLGAFDPLRGARRSFQLSRIEDLSISPNSFEPDPSWRVSAVPEERRAVTVRLHFPAELKRAVRERRSFFWAAEREVEEGVEVTLHVHALSDISAWVLAWGADVRVLEPPELRDWLREEARRILLT